MVSWNRNATRRFVTVLDLVHPPLGDGQHLVGVGFIGGQFELDQRELVAQGFRQGQIERFPD